MFDACNLMMMAVTDEVMLSTTSHRPRRHSISVV
jgi:hypothetical protein